MPSAKTVWVTHTSHFSKNGRVHQPTCRYAGPDKTYGYWLEAEKLWEKDAHGIPILDCKACGGREAK